MVKSAYLFDSGGYVMVYYGELNDGNYFTMDEYGNAFIYNAKPVFDESVDQYEWEHEHLVRELKDKAFVDEVKAVARKEI
jgi:hypothetical protein